GACAGHGARGRGAAAHVRIAHRHALAAGSAQTRRNAMPEIHLHNLAVLDPVAGELKSGCEILIRDQRIVSVEQGAIRAPGAVSYDLQGRTVMPGLIDCHVHINRSILPTSPIMLPSLMTAHA